jgi:hypothetical protein
VLPAAAEQAIQKQWLSLWPGLSSNIPTVLDDEAADQPATGYALLQVQGTRNQQWTVAAPGSRKFRRNGLILAKLNIPVDQGSQLALTWVGYVQQIFEGQRFAQTSGDDGVICYEASWRPVGTEGQFYSMLVTVPFTYYTWNV